MTDKIVRIGKPFGYDRAVRLMTADECREHDAERVAQELAASIAGSKYQLRQVFRHMIATHGDDTTQEAILAVASEFWPGK